MKKINSNNEEQAILNVAVNADKSREIVTASQDQW